MEIRELLPSEKGHINDIAEYEDLIFGDGGIGRWTIMPFVRYGKVYVYCLSQSRTYGEVF